MPLFPRSAIFRQIVSDNGDRAIMDQAIYQQNQRILGMNPAIHLVDDIGHGLQKVSGCERKPQRDSTSRQHRERSPGHSGLCGSSGVSRRSAVNGRPARVIRSVVSHGRNPEELLLARDAIACRALS